MTSTSIRSRNKKVWADLYDRLVKAPPHTRIAVESIINESLPQRSRQLARAKLLRLDPTYEGLRQECKQDLKRFAEEFFPHLCSDPFSTMHEEFFDNYRQRADERRWRDVTAAPRGNAKTTIKAFIKIIHDCVYEHEDYILILSSRHEMAKDKVKDIRDELDNNERLNLVYGPQEGPLWNLDDFITTRVVYECGLHPPEARCAVCCGMASVLQRCYLTMPRVPRRSSPSYKGISFIIG